MITGKETEFFALYTNRLFFPSTFLFSSFYSGLLIDFPLLTSERLLGSLLHFISHSSSSLPFFFFFVSWYYFTFSPLLFFLYLYVSCLPFLLLPCFPHSNSPQPIFHGTEQLHHNLNTLTCTKRPCSYLWSVTGNIPLLLDQLTTQYYNTTIQHHALHTILEREIG